MTLELETKLIFCDMAGTIFHKAVGLSIAFNAHKDLQAVATYSINQSEGQEDFRAMLPILSLP